MRRVLTPPEARPFNRVERFIASVVVPTLRPWLRETWGGIEHVPARGGAVVAANHLSYSDPLVLGRFLVEGAGRFPRYLGKAEIFAVPVFGRLIRTAGQIPVQRGSARAIDSLDAAREAVRSGELVAVLPEGTVTRDPALWPMAGKTGAARIALSTGCPLVPVAMWGPELIMPPRRHADPRVLLRALRPGHAVSVVAGAPVPLDDLQGQPLSAEVLTEATARTMTAITELVAQLRGETAPTELMDNPRVVSRVRRRLPSRRGKRMS